MTNKNLLRLAFFLSTILFAHWLIARSRDWRGEGERFLDIKTYELKSSSLVLSFGVQDQHLSHRAVSNRFTHQLNYLEGEEFILFFPGKKIQSSEFLVEKVEVGPGELSFYLRLPLYSLSARLDFKLSDSGFYIEKKLFLRSEKDQKFLQKLCLINTRVGTRGEFTTFPGLGQPAYKGNLFFALLYPLSEVNNSGPDLSICYAPAKFLGSELWESYPAVLGVSEEGKTSEYFFKFLEEKRRRKPEPYLLYNTWYDLPGVVNEVDLAKSLEGLRRNLVEPYQVKLDAVVIDDGWDNFSKLWEFDSGKFPQGIARVKTWTEELGAEPGMWFSPAGGYSYRKYQRIFATLGEGYEKNLLASNIIYQGFCPAGKTYHQVFKRRILEETKNGVSYFKLDNIGTSCPIPWHGHRPELFSKTAVTEALIEVMNSAHQLNSKVFFNITVGTWLSPFWLLWADCVWMGGMDYGFSGPGSKREKNITYKDQNLYRLFREKSYQFPINGLMTHGIIKGKSLFPETGPLEEFERDLIMYLGRGVSMWELYISPELLTEEEWKVLAQWIHWAKQNWYILKNSQMVLGDPNKLKPYGYLHQGEGQALLVLRNPWDQAQAVSISPEQLGIKHFSAITEEYPEKQNLMVQDQVLKISLTPFEVKILRFR